VGTAKLCPIPASFAQLSHLLITVSSITARRHTFGTAIIHHRNAKEQ